MQRSRLHRHGVGELGGLGELVCRGRDPFRQNASLFRHHRGISFLHRLAQAGQRPGGIAGGQPWGKQRVAEPGAAWQSARVEECSFNLGQRIVEFLKGVWVQGGPGA